MTAKRGRFIVLEGTDGSGTTTQCVRLVESLAGMGISAKGTREPSSGPVGRLLRAALEKRLTDGLGAPRNLDWATLALLFAADRTDHVAREILPALERGEWVVSDRYDLSSLIYQSLTAPDPAVALDWVRDLNARALRPDLVLVLDVDAEVAEQRRQTRGGAEELFDHRELQQRLAEAYCGAEPYASSDVLIHINGASTPAAVAAEVLGVVLSRVQR